MEGAPHPHHDCSEHAGDVTHDLCRGYPHDVEAAGTQRSIALLVAQRAGAVVTRPIHLDDQPGRNAAEIGDVGVQRMLEAKLITARLAAQVEPELRLGWAESLAQAAGRIDDGALQLLTPPSTTLRAVPLPVPGRMRGRRRGH